jgi:hypothetical protein
MRFKSRGYNGNMKIYTTILASALIALPGIAAAQFGGIDTFLGRIGTFINNVLIPLIFAFALLFFIYGMFKYFIQGGDNDGNRETGKQLMIWAVIGFVLMVSIWGIVNLLAGGLGTALGTNNSGPNSIPTGPTTR